MCPIQSGGACFSPDNLESHASFAFNRYFKSKGSCNFDGSMFTFTDPCNFMIPYT
ncbi:Glucan endo-1,3-beta-glucosidase [Acorus calamus]|uniref:Glucan endo-1,3-beta-glucosidase n=1 Tax=Acorus calamus TaxID=4465 RepID=A0AAV9CUW7_ACOCL|nr:Glucan endo-1,3-beta-glucosidase [Acorus calamus]